MSRLDEIEKELRSLRREYEDTGQIVKDLQDKRQDTHDKIRALEREQSKLCEADSLQISDHAILRYAERHYGLDVEDLKKEMRTKLKGASELKTLRFEGFVVKGNSVVTYVPTTEDRATVPAIKIGKMKLPPSSINSFKKD